MSAATLSALQGHELINNVDNFPKRGGMAMVNVGDDLIVIFGGVDRQQEHFNDLLVASVVDGKVTTRLTECSGDVPNPRSGHSMVSYGPYVFLFGGIDFIEEAVYNDIYILDTRSWTWGYVGEGGHEVIGRNSHTMSILKDQEHHVLVISGGASPEHGPLRDTVYASLPPVDEIDFATIAVTWHLLECSDAPQSIPAAEMQSFCSLGNQLIVSGGRDIEGNILSDTWVLTATYAATAPETTPSTSAPATPPSGSFTLRWEKSESLQLPKPSCAHTSFLQAVGGEDLLFHTVGGFSYDGLAGYIHSCAVSINTTTGMLQRAGNWTTKTMSSKVATRFGHCLSALPRAFLSALTQSDTKLSRRIPASMKAKMMSVQQGTVGTVVPATETTESSAPSTSTGTGATSTETRVDSAAAVAAIVFGGVDIEADFNDLWVLI